MIDETFCNLDDKMRLRKEKQLLFQQIEELQKSFDDKEDQLRAFIRSHDDEIEVKITQI